jgi:deazaflavin-dependent oxidoreductase (nitroreductase family)
MPGHRSYDEANAFQRGLRRFASSGPGSWLFARILHPLDRLTHRLTGGRRTVAGSLAGLPIVMLTTTGQRSGTRRTVPVLGLPTSEGLVVVASSYGQEHHPGWYHNLRANPEGEVTVDGATRRFRAVEATDDRRARIVEEGLRVYPGFTTYERRAAHRRIAVFVLEDLAGA